MIMAHLSLPESYKKRVKGMVPVSISLSTMRLINESILIRDQNPGALLLVEFYLLSILLQL